MAKTNSFAPPLELEELELDELLLDEELELDVLELEDELEELDELEDELLDPPVPPHALTNTAVEHNNKNLFIPKSEHSLMLANFFKVLTFSLRLLQYL